MVLGTEKAKPSEKCRKVRVRLVFTSLIRANPEKATTEGETAGRSVLGEAGTRPAEKKSPGGGGGRRSCRLIRILIRFLEAATMDRYMTSLTREDVAGLVEAVCRGDDNAFHTLIEASPVVVPLLTEHFAQKRDGESRARIVEVIWKRRESESTRFLSIALEDSHPAVWKEAIDGLVTIGGPESRHVLTVFFTIYPHDARAAWVSEALGQVRD